MPLIVWAALLLLNCCSPGFAKRRETYTVKIVAESQKGERLSNARITVRGPAGPALDSYTGQTDSNGEKAFELSSPGVYEYTIAHKSHRTASSRFTLGKTPLTVKAILSSQTFYGIDFVVLDPAGKPVPHAWVTMQLADDKVGVSRSTQATDGDGKAEFNSDNPGAYTITAGADSYETATSTVTLESSVTRLNYPVRLKGKNPRILVSVKSTDRNEPVADAKVLIQSDDGILKDTLTTDATGIAQLILPDSAESKPDRAFKVTVTHADYDIGTGSVTPEKGTPKDLSVTVGMKRKADREAVLVTVLTEKDQPLAAANVTLRGRLYHYTGTTGADGQALFSAKADRYVVSVTHNGYAPAQGEAAVSLTDDRKTNSVKIPLEKRGSAKELPRGVPTPAPGKAKTKTEKGLSGELVLTKSSLPVGESLTASVKLKLSGTGKARVRATLTLAVYGPPTGGKVKSQVVTRTLTRDRNNISVYAFRFDRQGEYTMKVKVVTPGSPTWNSSAKFIVVNPKKEPDKKPVQPANFSGSQKARRYSHVHSMAELFDSAGAFPPSSPG